MRAGSAGRIFRRARRAHGGYCALRVSSHGDGGGAVGSRPRPRPGGTEDEPVGPGGYGVPRGPGSRREKQMDSLRTNHQGTYVLQDNSFPLLLPMASGLQYLEEAPKFLAFTCGLLRGALCTLGIESVVTASVAALPICKFQVVIPKS
ncbi:PREDICTED: trafficking protein particle complex subunit 6A isoform X2 [Rhinopithecus bieti]|uniref:trafficking protein particle complex subunit 6A isoform X2 n=1 Tax=Rhinopithecus bieti TaxID=61621 RepID=UPI00083BEC82|nr:PREDICTED: trafficking protein particle complex subunit 6A isoform X2 [Rhinopithecus bieti]